MDYQVKGMASRLLEGKALADAANYPAIRHRKVSEKSASLPQADLTGGSWVVCTPQSVYGFSGVAFVFAQPAHGTEDSHRNHRLRGEVRRSSLTYQQMHSGTSHAGQTCKVCQGPRFRGDQENARRNLCPKPGLVGRSDLQRSHRPCRPLWHMRSHLVSSGIKLRQRRRPRNYRYKQRALVEEGGDKHGATKTAVFSIQLPQWKSYAWTYAREEQFQALEVDGTGMAVTIDLDHANDIHPPNKVERSASVSPVGRWPSFTTRKFRSAAPCFGKPRF